MIIVVELCVVLAAFPLRSTFAAVAALAQELLGERTTNGPSVVFDAHPDLTNLVSSVYLVVYSVAPLLLVWYLMRRDGGGLEALGLDARNVPRDIVAAAPLAILAFVANHVGGLLPTPYPRAAVATAVPVRYAFFLITQAVSAGVLEEMVVLGFLTTRLRQIGAGVPAAVFISLLVRTSYHAEYGFAMLGPALFGFVITMNYLRSRRLLPAIVAHSAVDVYIALHAVTFT